MRTKSLAIVSALLVALCASLIATPAQAAVDTTSYKSVALAAHVAGLESTKAIGPLPSSRYTYFRGDFRVPNDNWNVALELYSVTYGVNSAHAQTVAYAKGASQRLTALGLHLVSRYSRTGEGTFSTYGSASLRCSVTATPLGASVACAKTLRVSSIGTQYASYKAAYQAKGLTVAGKAFNVEHFGYGTMNYRYAKVDVHDVLNGAGGIAYFYRAPGGAWTYLLTADGVPQCSELEKYQASSRALMGQPCLRGDVESTVVAH